MDSFTAQYSGWDLTLWITQSRFGLEGSSITGVQSTFLVSFTNGFNSNSQPFRRCDSLPENMVTGVGYQRMHKRRQITWSRNLIPGQFGMLLAFMRMSWYMMMCMNVSKTDTLFQPFTHSFPRANIHELLAPDLLHQVIKGIFKDHLVLWVGLYLEHIHGKACAHEIMGDIDWR
jgi:hypothetical protein